MFPARFLLPAVALAAIATTIVSQAVISGAYPMSCEAFKLGFLPRMEVCHTSESKRGQIYVPAVNTLREFTHPPAGPRAPPLRLPSGPNPRSRRCRCRTLVQFNSYDDRRVCWLTMTVDSTRFAVSRCLPALNGLYNHTTTYRTK